MPGHWEGDLIVGLNSSAIGTLVERTTRFTMLLHLPPMEGHSAGPRAKNGPALAGHGAEAVRDAIAAAITTLPGQLRRSLTWDQGAEMASHPQLRAGTGLAVYFCDPHSPWQRATNENTNGLLRQYFPKGTGLSQAQPRRPRRSCRGTQRPPPQDTRLEDPGRSDGRAAGRRRRLNNGRDEGGGWRRRSPPEGCRAAYGRPSGLKAAYAPPAAAACGALTPETHCGPAAEPRARHKACPRRRAAPPPGLAAAYG